MSFWIGRRGRRHEAIGVDEKGVALLVMKLGWLMLWRCHFEVARLQGANRSWDISCPKGATNPQTTCYNINEAEICRCPERVLPSFFE